MLSGCGKKDDVGCASDYDQTALLENVANNLIIPAYQNLLPESSSLKIALDAFKSDYSVANLEVLQNQIKSTYLVFQLCAQFEFGPAESLAFRATTNNFPLNLAEFESNVEMTIPNMTDITRYDKGLPALDYIFYGTADNQEDIVSFLASNEHYIAYAELIVDQLIQQVEVIGGQWQTYKNDFIANQGTNAGSSMSLIVNALNQNFEISKRDRIGIPSGVLTLNFTNPDKVEAFYGGYSNDLLKASLDATISLYLGRDEHAVNREGLDDLLKIINAKKDGALLHDIIEEQYSVLLLLLDNIEGELSTAVDQESGKVIDLYKEMSNQVINTKTDMCSVMCISITYVDAPSDTD